MLPSDSSKGQYMPVLISGGSFGPDLLLTARGIVNGVCAKAIFGALLGTVESQKLAVRN